MPITDFLERNAKNWPDDIALVEINPDREGRKTSNWAEFSLVETDPETAYRRELTDSPICCLPQGPKRATRSRFC